MFVVFIRKFDTYCRTMTLFYYGRMLRYLTINVNYNSQHIDTYVQELCII